MILEGNESLNTDALETSSDSEAPAVDSNNSEAGSVEAKPSAPVENKTTDITPFHEHPRFKELVEQKNQFASETKQLKDQLARMQAQMEQFSKANQPAPKADPMIERLKGIDPEFAQYVEKLNAGSREVESLRANLQELQTREIRTQALATVDKLYHEHKVPENLKNFYGKQLDAEVARNPNARVEDLPAIFKSVHDSISKTLEDIKRSEREAYSKGKVQSAAAPTTQSKGKPVSHSNKFEYSKDPDEARSQMIQRILKQSRAANDI